mgnify:CR=1 FL=1
MADKNLKVEIRKPTQADVDNLIKNMRQADRNELMALHNEIGRIVQYSFERSEHKWSVYANGEFVCMFGVGYAALVSDTGIIWMLGTDLIEQYKGAFIRHSKRYIEAMLTIYPVLSNYCDVRNKRTIRWLKFMGFTFSEPTPRGVHNLPFVKFELKRD